MASLAELLAAPIKPAPKRKVSFRHPPTEEQTLITQAVKAGGNLMIEAYAGTGKTTTLVDWVAPNLSPVIPALALAFNVKIKADLEGRFPPHFKVMTLNGLGHQAWGRKLGKACQVDPRKLGKIVTSEGRAYGLTREQWQDSVDVVTAAMQAGLVPSGQGLVKDLPSVWEALAEDAGASSHDKMLVFYREVLLKSISEGMKGLISFDDQVYLPTLFGGQFPAYRVVLVDEAQDLNSLQHMMIGKTATDRLIVVGDRHQCHPAGTQITLEGGKLVDIKDIKVGDSVVTLEMGHGWFAGLQRSKGIAVLNKAEFSYEGPMLRLQTPGGFSHDCTPEHRCLVKFNRTPGYCIYLMRKGNSFRIGQAKVHYTKGMGAIKRATTEKADALWLLSYVVTKEQAMIEEKVLTFQFGLPDIQFTASSEKSYPQDVLDTIWSRIGNNTEAAQKCLNAFGRKLEFPLWPNAKNTLGCGERPFITEACNVQSEIMSLRIFDGDASNVNWQTVHVSSYPFKGMVYGLEVEPNKNSKRLYLANNIVTHNSIYGFRGAHPKSMDELKSLRSAWTILPLSLTFRCPPEIVQRQQRHAPGYRSNKASGTGEVRDLKGTWGWAEVAGEDVAILCRNNAPLLALAFKLLRQGIAPVVLGRDIGKGLVKLSREIVKSDNIPSAKIADLVCQWMDRSEALAKANDEEEKIDGILDKGESLLAVLGSLSPNATAGQLRVAIEALFAKETGRVTLSSIHKSKGLEYGTVVHLDPWRLPSKLDLICADRGNRIPLAQSANLKYVIETRAKETLIMANLSDFQ